MAERNCSTHDLQETVSGLVSLIQKVNHNVLSHTVLDAMSGDGHSFDDSYAEREVIDREWDEPSAPGWRRYQATKDLKRILQQTDSPIIAQMCREGITHKYALSGRQYITLTAFTALRAIAVLSVLGYGIYKGVTYLMTEYNH